MKANFSAIVDGIRKRSPEIMTGIGIAGMATSVVLAVRQTSRALMLIEDAKIEKGDELTTKEKVKECWKCYIPPTVTFISSAACLIGASSTHLKRNAALATAYELSRNALSEYRDAVVETIGENAEKEIRSKVAEKKLEADPASKKEVIITGKGDSLCYDALGGRYFKSDMDRIKKAENEINRILLRDNYVSLNDFYDELRLDHTKLGDELGWRVDDGLINLDFDCQIADDGTPCLVIDYDMAPRYGYSNFV